MPTKPKVRCALADARKKRGVSQTWLSQHTGIDVSTISKHENQHHIPTFVQAVRYADALGCRVDELIEVIGDVTT